MSLKHHYYVNPVITFNSHDYEDELIEDHFRGLQVGDVIVECCYVYDPQTWHKVSKGGCEVSEIANGNTIGYALRTDGTRDGAAITLGSDKLECICRVLRRSTPKTVANNWNGRCSSCGKGTYTGFTSVEHEGGVCS